MSSCGNDLSVEMVVATRSYIHGSCELRHYHHEGAKSHVKDGHWGSIQG